MAFKTPAQIAAEMVATAKFLTKGKIDPFDHRPVGDDRYYFPVRGDVTVNNGAQVAREIRKIAKPMVVQFAEEAIAHFAMPRATHDARDAFKKTF